MAAPPLATAADLDARGISYTPAQADAFLAAASEAVRDAAGYVISRTVSTVTFEAPSGPWLPLSWPVVSVASVSVDGTVVDDWRLVDGRLWRQVGWRADRHEPSVVSVTLTHGYDPVPADIVDLVCAMVGSAVAASADGYQSTSGLQSRTRQVDDYRETDTYETGAAGVSGRMELPAPTRDWLRRRFSGAVFTTGAR